MTIYRPQQEWGTGGLRITLHTGQVIGADSARFLGLTIRAVPGDVILFIPSPPHKVLVNPGLFAQRRDYLWLCYLAVAGCSCSLRNSASASRATTSIMLSLVSAAISLNCLCVSGRVRIMWYSGPCLCCWLLMYTLYAIANSHVKVVIHNFGRQYLCLFACGTPRAVLLLLMPSFSILVVEDNPDIADLVSEILSLEGYKVVVTHNGLEALKRIQREPPDLVITDVKMPVMDGSDLCKRLQSHPELSSIPIVLVSAAADLYLEKYQPAAIVKKPIDMKELIETVSRTLSKRLATS